jgi:hypothetical protein
MNAVGTAGRALEGLKRTSSPCSLATLGIAALAVTADDRQVASSPFVP